MAHFETTQSRREVFRGKVFTVTVDQALLENGRTAEREVVHHNGGACIAALMRDGRVYLVRQFRYPFGREVWELPAGKLEAGEAPLAAAKRELEEECGLAADHWRDLHPIWPTVAYCSEVIHTYLATGLRPVPMHLDEDEFLTPQALPLDEAVAMVLDGRIVDGKTGAALLKVQALRGAGLV